MKVNNKVIIVTGGGSGIGRELVLLLLSKNAKVIAIDINEKSLEETFAISGANQVNLRVQKVDITKKDSVASFFQNALKIWGHVDGIINNAGIIQPFIRVNDLNYEDIDRVMNVNFYGTLYMIKAFLPHLFSRPEAHIVNISSMGGFLPVPGQTVYGASKAAVKLLTEGLYAELIQTSVNVTIVFPGAVSTNIVKNSGLDMPSDSGNQEQSMKSLPASKAALQIIEGMETNQFRVLVGNDSKFLDKLYRFNPKSATKFIAKKMQALLK